MDLQAAKGVIEYFAEVKKDVKFELLLRKWTTLKEIVYVLQIPLHATFALQKQDLTLSDAFGVWIKMKIHFQACCRRGSFKTNLAKHFLNALESRNKFVFQNKFMKCALFLDPRFRQEILRDEIVVEEAKQTLLQLWCRIQNNESKTNTSESESTSCADHDFEFDEQSELQRYLSRHTQNSNNALNMNQHESIEMMLDSFDPDPLAADKSILDYWDTVREIHPNLYQLAMVVYAVPPTEVQIERDFSKLKHVFSDRRCQIQSERLEDIMIININPEIFYVVKEEEINNLRKVNEHFQ